MACAAHGRLLPFGWWCIGEQIEKRLRLSLELVAEELSLSPRRTFAGGDGYELQLLWRVAGRNDGSAIAIGSSAADGASSLQFR
jgi:hypothetical protein